MERWFSPIDRSLRRELKPAFATSYWFDTTTYKELVELRLKYKDGLLQIFFPSTAFLAEGQKGNVWLAIDESWRYGDLGN